MRKPTEMFIAIRIQRCVVQAQTVHTYMDRKSQRTKHFGGSECLKVVRLPLHYKHKVKMTESRLEKSVATQLR